MTRISRARRGFTMLELLITASILTLATVSIWNLNNSTLRTGNIAMWTADKQSELVFGLKFLREEIARATYPSKVFWNGSFIYGPAADEPGAYAPTLTDQDPGNAWYLHFRQGTLTVPGPPGTISDTKLAHWRNCSPKYGAEFNDAAARVGRVSDEAWTAYQKNPGKQTDCEIWLVGAGPKSGVPAIVYKRTTTGGDKMDRDVKDKAAELISSVKEVRLEAKSVDPPGNKSKISPWEKRGTLWISVKLHSGFQSPTTAKEIEESIMAKANVRIVEDTVVP